MATKPAAQAFQVTPWSHRVGGWVERHRDLMLRLAESESQALEDYLEANPVKAPVYVSGLARAGTTIMLEALASHPDVGTHRYSDYPLVFLPYWWGKMSRHFLKAGNAESERAHGDRIKVTPHSPEAMEEALWMGFFDNLHGDKASAVLGGETSNPAFERHYRAHVAKLLLVRERLRYVSKANYNVSRLAYLQKIFPDARFIVPVREPQGHIVSLMRQHRRFSEGLAGNAKAREHLRRVGHFEFGPDREAIAVADMADIRELWSKGEEIRGWSRYWARLHGFIAGQMESTGNLNGAALVLRYEDLCRSPLETFARVFNHAELEAEPTWLQGFASRISAPGYYEGGLSEEEQGIIREETDDVARRLGYAS